MSAGIAAAAESFLFDTNRVSALENTGEITMRAVDVKELRISYKPDDKLKRWRKGIYTPAASWDCCIRDNHVNPFSMHNGRDRCCQVAWVAISHHCIHGLHTDSTATAAFDSCTGGKLLEKAPWRDILYCFYSKKDRISSICPERQYGGHSYILIHYCADKLQQ
jgi:hypothetical protein